MQQRHFYISQANGKCSQIKCRLVNEIGEYFKCVCEIWVLKSALKKFHLKKY